MAKYTQTENGALTLAASGSKVLDFYYHAPARRGKNIEKLFQAAYAENPVLTVASAANLRDVRGGKGERDLFRQCLKFLPKQDLYRILHLIPLYGRWDDMLEFVDDANVVEFIKQRLMADLQAANDGKPITLLAKWMPSENAGKASRLEAQKWIAALEMYPSTYRRMLSRLRKYLGVVESQMSDNNWRDIVYARVPSRAAMIYRKAFAKHDAERYAAYLKDVEEGKQKINSGTLFPYELVNRVRTGADRTVDALWKALPDYTEGRTFLAICDTSGSMTRQYVKNQPTPIDVAVSLAIYGAQRAQGPFNGVWLSFNDTATVNVLKGNTLSDIVANVIKQQDWGGSTNVQSALQKILTIATRNNIPPEGMPEVLFIISDMQFNPTGLMRNYEVMKRRFELAGYEAPIIVFWNVNSRVNESPVSIDETGAYLVSGCSPSVFKAALKTEATTPYQMMVDELTSDRYQPVIQALTQE